MWWRWRVSLKGMRIPSDVSCSVTSHPGSLNNVFVWVFERKLVFVEKSWCSWKVSESYTISISIAYESDIIGKIE